MNIEDAVGILSSVLPTSMVDELLQAHKFPGHPSPVNTAINFDPFEQQQFQYSYPLMSRPAQATSSKQSPPKCRMHRAVPSTLWQGDTRQHRMVEFTPGNRGRGCAVPRAPLKKVTQGPSAMGTLLKDIEDVSPDRVVKIRKIHHLVRHAFEAVWDHCAIYGRVDDILSLPLQQTGRRRPSTLAFVVMRDATATNEVLAAGWQQCVMGQTLLFERYEHHGVANPTAIIACTASTASTAGSAEDGTICTMSASCSVSVGSRDEDVCSVATIDLRDQNEQAIQGLAEFEFVPTDDEWE